MDGDGVGDNPQGAIPDAFPLRASQSRMQTEMDLEIISPDIKTTTVEMNGVIQLSIDTVAETMMEMAFPMLMTLVNGTLQSVQV